MEQQELLEMLRANVLLVRAGIMVGNQAPSVRKVYDAAFSPRPGDLVIETSMIYYAIEPKRIGTLLREVREEIPGVDPLPDGRPQTERVFYIRDLDGVEQRWVNADFMRIARDLRDVDQMTDNPMAPPYMHTDENVRRERVGWCRTCGRHLESGHVDDCPGPA